jgi:hypothetical protein
VSATARVGKVPRHRRSAVMNARRFVRLSDIRLSIWTAHILTRTGDRVVPRPPCRMHPPQARFREHCRAPGWDARAHVANGVVSVMISRVVANFSFASAKACNKQHRVMLSPLFIGNRKLGKRRFLCGQFAIFLGVGHAECHRRAGCLLSFGRHRSDDYFTR